MTKKIYAALVSLVAAVAALSPAGPAEAAVHCDDHQQCQHKAARRTRRRTPAQRQRARRRDKRRAVAYVCPMHPDIRERSRGTCPKCLMDLVAEPPGAKPGAHGAGAGVSASGGM
jgi:hypothetical protein